MSKRKSRATIIKGENNALNDLFNIKKANSFTNQEDLTADQYAGLDIIAPPYPIADLLNIVEMSTILQQCIEAYKRNIVGFGTTIEYSEDTTKEEVSPLSEAEANKIEEFMEYFNFDKSFTDVFATAIEDREKCGNGYIEILRDGKGEVVGGENVDPTHMRISKSSDTEVDYLYKGKSFKRIKSFRKFAQVLGQKYIWFKEFGDPRFLDSRTGKYTANHNGDYEANEVLHLKIGNKAYGVPRYIGHIIHMYGARKAEELNYNYFYNGRHTPAAIIVSNGLLTEDSIAKLEDYAKGVQGVDNAHKFLILEAEGLDDGVLPGEDRQGVKVELKPMAEILQQDALFLEYDEASRMKVQSAFRLPDIYVGRSTDYNRATADTAKQLTEEQVFEPERKSLEFILNRKLLADFQFQSAKLTFNPQVISDTEDKVKLLGALNTIGAVTPNDVRDEVSKVLGKDLEPFDLDEANLPTVLRNAILQKQNMELQAAANKQQPNNKQPLKKEAEELDTTDVFISLMKEVKDVLEELNDGQD